MQIESINAGEVETVSYKNKSMTPGICKRPLDGPVRVTRDGIAGDAIVATQYHGGPDQAIYAYSADDYDWWAANSEHDFFPGLFGENLTIRDLPSDMRVGDRLLIRDVVLEATAPRIPCDTFATRMQDPGFGLAFRKAEKPGIYLRVLNEGQIQAGDTVTFVESAETDVGIVDLFRAYYELSPDPEMLRRLLEAPIAERMRDRFEKALAKGTS